MSSWSVVRCIRTEIGICRDRGSPLIEAPASQLPVHMKAAVVVYRTASTFLSIVLTTGDSLVLLYKSPHLRMASAWKTHGTVSHHMPTPISGLAVACFHDHHGIHQAVVNVLSLKPQVAFYRCFIDLANEAVTADWLMAHNLC